MPMLERVRRMLDAKQGTGAQERSIRDALQAWKDASRFFESANDSELIDYAIYDMEAARRKYMFLLRQKARSEKTGTQK